MKHQQVTALLFLALFLASCGGQKTADIPKEHLTAETKEWASPSDTLRKYVYSRYAYTDPAGKRLIIRNGYPRGGMEYTDPQGVKYRYVVFWTRMENETDAPVELELEFPLNSIENGYSPGKFLNLLLPADTMTLDKVSAFSYGLTDLKPFFDRNLHKPSSLKRTIAPKGSSGFYVVILGEVNEGLGGAMRTELSLTGQELFYAVKILGMEKPLREVFNKKVPVGHISLKEMRSAE